VTTSLVNVAAGRPVTSSSAQGGYPASNAVDADVNSYWESANTAFPQWLQVDLGGSVAVGKVVLRLPPSTAWATRTQTVTVTDGATGAVLRPAVTVTFDPATGNTAILPFPAVSVRYLRVTVTGNTGWPAGQLSEVEAYSL
jgi:hypothetical protein